MNRVKELRLQCGMSQQALAKKLKISVNHLCRIENGERNLNYSLASRIAKELDCMATEIFLE